MKCSGCNSEVSIADSKCPQCGSDLLQFGATTFYEPGSKDGQRYGQGVKEMVFGGLGKETVGSFTSLDAEERKILSPTEKRLKSLFEKHLSDEELDEVFFTKAIPLLNDSKRDVDTAASLRKIETTIKSMIGSDVFQFYDDPKLKVEYAYKGKKKVVVGRDILDILRMGELIFDSISKTYPDLTDVDYTAAMFSYFKASEVACLLHSYDRYDDLRDHNEIKDFVGWLGDSPEDIYIVDIPRWLVNRKKTLIDTMQGIYRGRKDDINGSLRTGIAIFVLGRNWMMQLKRNGSSAPETYQLKNLMNTMGRNEEKEALADNLSKIQTLRNPRVHNEVEKDRNKVVENRRLSYDCLKGIYRTLGM